MAQAESEQLSVVIFPWLAHGRINPTSSISGQAPHLHRTNQQSDVSVGVVIHVVSTPDNLLRRSCNIRQTALSSPTCRPCCTPAIKHTCDFATLHRGSGSSSTSSIYPDGPPLCDFLSPWAPLEAAVPTEPLRSCSAAAFVHRLSADCTHQAFPLGGHQPWHFR
ncbi:unnamed protein product [Urochloa humidicola]